MAAALKAQAAQFVANVLPIIRDSTGYTGCTPSLDSTALQHRRQAG
jgi:hypothetical protein